jgi:FkbM family methyltransferase
MKELQLLPKGSVVFDVGANRGQSIEFFLRVSQDVEVYSFEPAHKIFESLREIYGKSKGIYLFNIAMGSTEEQKIFFEHPFDETSTFIKPNVSSVWQSRKEKILGIERGGVFSESLVEVSTIDRFCSDHQISRIDLLKVDVEGYELEVLKGATKILEQGIVKAIQIERHQDDMREDISTDVHALLIKKGFFLQLTLPHLIGNYYEDIYQLQA